MMSSNYEGVNENEKTFTQPGQGFYTGQNEKMETRERDK